MVIVFAKRHLLSTRHAEFPNLWFGHIFLCFDHMCYTYMTYAQMHIYTQQKFIIRQK